jgi:hypothetical protein
MEDLRSWCEEASRDACCVCSALQPFVSCKLQAVLFEGFADVPLAAVTYNWLTTMNGK